MWDLNIGIQTILPSVRGIFMTLKVKFLTLRLAQELDSYNMDLIIYQKNLNSFKMLLGVGQLSTSDQKKGAIGIIRLTHEIAPSISLF